MKNLLSSLVIFIVGVIIILGFIYAYRWVSGVSTPVTLVKPEPGVHCALASNSHGSAISCWKTDRR